MNYKSLKTPGLSKFKPWTMKNSTPMKGMHVPTAEEWYQDERDGKAPVMTFYPDGSVAIKTYRH